MKKKDPALKHKPAVADHDSREINGQKPATAEDHGQSKGQQAKRSHKHGIKAGRIQVNRVDDSDRRIPDGHAHQRRPPFA